MNDGPYRVELSRTARRALAERLPLPVAFAVLELLEGPLARRSYQIGAPLLSPFLGQWRGRRGEYRIRHRIDEESRTVHVLDIDHRRDIYRS